MASPSVEVPAGNNGGGGGAVHRYFGGYTDKDMVDAANPQITIIVATLITTITFAAAFAVPGSYETEAQPKGAPILLKNAAFQAFLVTNTVAFVCSLAAIFAYIVMVEEAMLYKRSKPIWLLYDYSGFLVLVALIAIVLAFVTGSYSILAHAHSTAIAVTVTVLGLTFFPLIFYVLRIFILGGAISNTEILDL
ncbi:PREDICTED: protein ACCELERATED CELL DEATH 6-like [Ipomoea nil]|uniref:protein ACCELERATED CELL DEATH 6-like n=1 Tax=Ipomoea nil TaxID=35883 RepID=UPI0009014831|nr:PREDICTED: protein ACCELERATED CELL DEATH 6-like [Ipomoea nil]